MRRFWSCLVCAVFMIAGAISGFIIGMQGPEWIDAGIFNYWRSFHLPNRSKAVRFSTLTSGESIAVETEEDGIYFLSLSFDENPAWVADGPIEHEEQSPKSESGGACSSKKSYHEGLIILPHFKTEIDRIYCRYYQHAEYGGDLVFIIDRKGGVYRWMNKDLGYGSLFWFPLCGVGGVILGAIFGWFIYSRVPWRISEQSSEIEGKRDRWKSLS